MSAKEGLVCLAAKPKVSRSTLFYFSIWAFAKGLFWLKSRYFHYQGTRITLVLPPCYRCSMMNILTSVFYHTLWYAGLVEILRMFMPWWHCELSLCSLCQYRLHVVLVADSLMSLLLFSGPSQCTLYGWSICPGLNMLMSLYLLTNGKMLE